MNRFILILFWFSCSHFTLAQSVSTHMGARCASLEYSTATVADEFAIVNNPGGIGTLSQSAFVLASEVTPALVGHRRMAAGLVTHTPVGNFGLAAFRFGDDLYNEQFVGLSYGHQVQNTSLGIRANYVQYYNEIFGAHSTVSIDFGGITELTPTFAVGAYMLNLTQSKLNAEVPQPLPTRMLIGIRYQPAKHARLFAEAEKDLQQQKPIVRGAFEYGFKEKFYLRTGFSMNTPAAAFGFGFVKNKARIDVSANYNRYQLFSYQASSQIRFGNKTKKT